MTTKTHLPHLTPVSSRIVVRHYGTHWKIVLDGDFICTFADNDFAIRLLMLTAQEISNVAGVPKFDIEASHAKVLQVKRIAMAKRETLIGLVR